MTTVFVVCAAVGGTILVFQFVLTMIGLGGEAFDLDVAEIDADVDFDADMDIGSDTDLGHDVHVGSSWLFGVISFRTVVSALAFFGLVGLTAQSAGASPVHTLLIAVAAGVAAMYALYWMMRGLKSLKSEGTPRIQRAVGRHGTVYVTIPGGESSAGKIQINLQNRTMEYLAMTSGEKLPPGSKVVVVGVITPTTVEVQPVLDQERSNDV